MFGYFCEKMFEVREISVRAGAKAIVENISLYLEAGEVVALIGANGAGKSTVLKAMCGDVKPSTGQILFENRPLKEWDYHELARRRAVLSQNLHFNFPFTAREVVLLGRNPHIRGSESKKDLAIAEEALKLVEATHLAERSFPTLSGGEQQRVHLARTLAQIWDKPYGGANRYLLLDEPTSNLDLAHQHLTLRLARKFSLEGVGILIILHDLNLAARYADRIYLLKQGRILASGKPVEVLTVENIESAFGFAVEIFENKDKLLIMPKDENFNMEERRTEYDDTTDETRTFGAGMARPA